MFKQLSFILLTLSTSILFAQKADVNEFDPAYINWYNKDLSNDKLLGASIDKTYDEILINLTPKKTVVVAVIDGGVDINHKDLENKIWVNDDEIPNNGIDDDNNGYIDDINGWNFIGNKEGENVLYENLEFTRIVKSQDTNHKDYERAKKLYNEELSKRKKQLDNYLNFKNVWDNSKRIIKENTDIEIKSQIDLRKVNSNKSEVLNAASFLNKKYDQGVDDEYIEDLINHSKLYLDYYLNVDFDARKLVGDDPLNMEERSYGNNNVKGSRSDHGTTVAGVIAATRDNNIGINGIVNDVKIMVLKSTPDGDERDKDVALSIIYAVDNGADIINMSFSKELSPQKEFVDKAIRYAEENGVLLIHGAGNKGENLDQNERFPSDIYLDKVEATNFLNIGATQMNLNAELIGTFSNYGIKHVDIYAPGVDLISLDSSNTYKKTTGTSIAAPVVSGVAALILSYYPDLTPQELITILLESSYKVTKPKKILTPNLASSERQKAKFSTLSKSGGIINAYNAFLNIQNNMNNKE